MFSLHCNLQLLHIQVKNTDLSVTMSSQTSSQSSQFDDI